MLNKFFFSNFIILIFSISIFSQQIDSQYFNENSEVYFKFHVENKSQVDQLTKIISIDNFKNDTVFAYANEKEFNNFLKLNYDYSVLPSPGKRIYPRMTDSPLGINEWDVYPTYDAYVAMMNQFAADYPDICQLIDAGPTVQGREILFVKISDNVTQRETEPQFMFTSSMHGDETTGYVLMLRLIDSLLTSYGTDTRITNLINNIEIWINPLANPDGTYHSGNGTVYGATRYNANSIDLNRNFPDPADGPHPDGNAYQPETIDMINIANANNFILSANFHGGAEVANYPWDTWSRLHPDDNWYQLICHEFADTAQTYSPNGYMDGFNDGITNGYAWYRVAGGRQDFMTYFKHGRENTIEISNTKLLSPSLLPAWWGYLKRSFLNYIENSLYGIRGFVTDTSGIPVNAKIEVENHDADNSFVYSDTTTQGSYYRLIHSGTYNLIFSAEGYETDTVPNVVVANYQATNLNVQLIPESLPVELISFSAVNHNNNVELSWKTATETNNKGFEIQRSSQNKDWKVLSFINGNGSSNDAHFYKYSDNNLENGFYNYRLKQIDLDGTFKYSKIISVNVNQSINSYNLAQNYPNPFNPSTVINYSIPEKSFVQLNIYNLLGQKVQSLINEVKEAGIYKVVFNASKLSSGIYFYELNTPNQKIIKKMILAK